MRTNLLPAILIAGPPHSGKSVLSFLLTQKLRELSISHYLLRAAPDGEGDWYHLGQGSLVRSLRQAHKGDYSPKFVDRVRSIIEKRHLPLLVDIGGKPRGDQFNILKACTHSILLYRTEEERNTWNSYLGEMDLLPIAELQSSLTQDDAIHAIRPVLHGTISGLDRQNWQVGATFGALLDRTAGICHYEETDLEKVHIQQAPYPVLIERHLANQINVRKEKERLIWDPRNLKTIPEKIPPGEPRGIYGRGPVWLAGMLAAYISPTPLAIFDARFGWLTLPKVCFQDDTNVKVQVYNWVEQDAQFLSIKLPEVEIEPTDIRMPPIRGENGLVISGVLPRWFYAALASEFASKRAWIAVDDPALDRIVVVHSTHHSKVVGNILIRPKSFD